MKSWTVHRISGDTPEMPGNKQTIAPHDFAYAVYTSGSTGTPKGVLHEFENLDEVFRTASYEKKPTISASFRCTTIAPFRLMTNCTGAGGIRDGLHYCQVAASSSTLVQ